jgi:hypothetical protein
MRAGSLNKEGNVSMLGKNPVAGSRIASEGFLVNNVWFTLQGEGVK